MIIWIFGLLSLTATAGGTTTHPNANHVFNAIHSSMRQWGSSVHHNGMSFFLATVPEGTQFYHGTSTPYPINGIEWLAFEPEHAMGFARPRGSIHKPGPERKKSKLGGGRDSLQHQIKGAAGDSSINAGYLHTYTAAKDLRLLYLDGMAAGKSAIGTLDAQDRILLNDTLVERSEKERAEIACGMADGVWEGRIDGVLRMEAGFEIILCHFERDLQVVRVTQAKEREPRDAKGHPHGDGRSRKPGGPGGPGGGGGRGGGGIEYSWVKAVAARYHDIGGNRVSLNFDNFVTAYDYNLDLFAQDPERPRLAHLSTGELEPIREDLKNLVMMQSTPDPPSFDWQVVADMIVTRYSDELQYMANGNLSLPSELRQRAEQMLGAFIDYSDANNTEATTDRCADQFIPRRSPTSGLAFQAIRSVSRIICSTFTAALATEDVDVTKASFQDLVKYLSWTSWKECRGCAYDELCVIPMWPMGTVEDYEHPSCSNTDKGLPGDRSDSYWGPINHGGMGRP